ncbi:dynein regulatory complex protein 12-like isoform X1 [Clytia hemisphaerica]|uniref:Dynein regulatory complex protein 12 n=1 Tax=Clytia hemisphaerica TaxID=252671 RepID=A0A7M6DRP7_9CNID
MPPKKKVKKKRAKSAKASEPTIEEKYQQTIQKITSLQDHLAMRTEIARRSQLKSYDLRDQMRKANDEIIEERKSKHDISSDLIRQYKSMQKDLTHKTYLLENKILDLTTRLTTTEQELANERTEKQRIIEEKDSVIFKLERRLDHIENAYENILHDAFDAIVDKMQVARSAWQNESMEIQSRNKALLSKFGLNPLEI